MAPKTIKNNHNLEEKGHKYNELSTTTDFAKKAVSCPGEQIWAKKKNLIKMQAEVFKEGKPRKE